MTKFFDIINNSKLFKNIESNVIKNINIETQDFYKNDTIFNIGEKIDSIYMVLEGRVHITRVDYWGNQSILTEIREGEIFGEAYACSENTPIGVNAIAIRDTKIARFKVNELISSSPDIVKNLVRELAYKNIVLSNKADFLAQRSIRSKLTAYLSMESQRQGSSDFNIPFNRQQLADFLSVDRSAMSKELCKMRDEGIIEFHKNNFILK